MSSWYKSILSLLRYFVESFSNAAFIDLITNFAFFFTFPFYLATELKINLSAYVGKRMCIRFKAGAKTQIVQRNQF